MLKNSTEEASSNYINTEIPLISTAISQKPGLSIQAIDNRAPDELEVYVTLLIEGKGQVILINPTHEGLGNETPVYVRAFDGCVLASNLPLEKHLIFINDLVENYDLLQSKAQDEGLCEK